MQGQSDHQGKAIFGLASDQNAKIGKFQILILLFLLYVGVFSMSLFDIKCEIDANMWNIFVKSCVPGWLLPAIFRCPLCIKGPITVMSWKNLFCFLIAQICLLPHTIWATFCTVCGEKNLECFFNRPEAFLIRAVTAYLYLRRIFSHTKKGSVLIDVHLSGMLRRPTIWLKLPNVRIDKKYFEKAGIGKL